MLRYEDVTACLITKGDQPEMLARILQTLPYPEVIVWDDTRPEHRVYGRFQAMREAKTRVCYTQDDDCLFTHHDELMAAYEDGIPTYVYGHYPEEGGFGDTPLPCGGALVPKDVAFAAHDRYLEHYPADEAFLLYCDFACGILYPRFKQVHLPFEIDLTVAQRPDRICNTPGTPAMKQLVADRSRALRDRTAVAA
jgi:hypothetical protein